MKDLVALSYEVNRDITNIENSYNTSTELFTERLLEELKNVSGKQLAPYLTCEYLMPLNRYVIKIDIPARALEKL